jgi:hypothetical protein
VTATKRPKRPVRRRTRVIVAAAVVIAAVGALVAGLLFGVRPGRPHAPPLTNDAVYRNDAIGLQFLVPEGWSITSRTELPPGPLAKPLILATYIQGQADHPAELEVLAADVSEGMDLVRFLADNPIGATKWKAVGAPQSVSVNGAPATRVTLVGSTGKVESRREVTAFRRGDRTFLFMITYRAPDSAARDAARRAVESAAWSK